RRRGSIEGHQQVLRSRRSRAREAEIDGVCPHEYLGLADGQGYVGHTLTALQRPGHGERHVDVPGVRVLSVSDNDPGLPRITPGHLPVPIDGGYLRIRGL